MYWTQATDTSCTEVIAKVEWSLSEQISVLEQSLANKEMPAHISHLKNYSMFFAYSIYIVFFMS